MTWVRRLTTHWETATFAFPCQTPLPVRYWVTGEEKGGQGKTGRGQGKQAGGAPPLAPPQKADPLATKGKGHWPPPTPLPGLFLRRPLRCLPPSPHRSEGGLLLAKGEAIPPLGEREGPKGTFPQILKKLWKRMTPVGRKVSYTSCIFVYALADTTPGKASFSRGAGLGDASQHAVRMGPVGKNSALSAGRWPHILRK